MQYINFAWHYLWLVLGSWFGLALLVLSLFQFVEWLSGKDVPIPTWLRLTVFGLLLFVAQARVYKELADNPPTILKTPVPPPPIITKEEPPTKAGPKQGIQINSAPNGIAIGGGTVNNPTVNNGPPPLKLTPTLRTVTSDRPGFIKTEIVIVPSVPVPGPFQIVLDFDNPISSISASPMNLNFGFGGGPYQIGTHAFDSVGQGISASHPLLVVVYSVLPVKLTSAPTVE